MNSRALVNLLTESRVHFVTDPDDDGVMSALDRTQVHWEWDEMAESYVVPESQWGVLQARMSDLGYDTQEVAADPRGQFALAMESYAVVNDSNQYLADNGQGQPVWTGSIERAAEFENPGEAQRWANKVGGKMVPYRKPSYVRGSRQEPQFVKKHVIDDHD